MQLIGRLGGDAEVRDVNSTKVISFNVAHTEKYMDRKTNQMTEKTVWVRCSMWRDADKIKVADYLKKGTQVYVEGTPSSNAYMNKEGQPAASLECRVNTLELLGGRSSSDDFSGSTTTNTSNRTSNAMATTSSVADNLVDDLPF